ncbi:protein of unknown function [Burkholderia multivorans]
MKRDGACDGRTGQGRSGGKRANPTGASQRRRAYPGGYLANAWPASAGIELPLLGYVSMDGLLL